MMRYINSFLITTILYSFVIGVFFYAYSNQQLIIKNKIEKKSLSLKHIELIKKVEEKTPKIEKKIVKKIPKVIKPIEKVAKKPKSKPKIIKKKNKKVVKKRVVKKKRLKKIVKKEEPKIVEEVIKKEKVLNKVEKVVTNRVFSKPIVKNYKEEFLKKNLLLIKKYIQNHVKYSKRARKMNIEGDVLVEFSLSKNGQITDIKALSGHRLLRKSTIKAIHKASTYFPKVNKNITIKVPIEYKLI